MNQPTRQKNKDIQQTSSSEKARLNTEETLLNGISRACSDV